MITSKERLVIFIDDLDRCNQNSIFNLLDCLSIYFSDNFDVVTILNIDINIIADSIATKKLNERAKKNDAIHYLEKIIQLNYNIMDLDSTNCKHFLDCLLVDNVNILSTINMVPTLTNNKIRDFIIEKEEENLMDDFKDKKKQEVFLQLPFEIQLSIKNILTKCCNFYKITPRKIKRILNILKLVNDELNTNLQQYDADELVMLVCFLELQSDLASIILSKFKTEDTTTVNVSNLNSVPRNLGSFANFIINKNLFMTVIKYTLFLD